MRASYLGDGDGRLRAQPDYTYPVANISIIARKYNADENKMRQVVFDYGLFTIIEDRMFFSNGLKMRMQPMDEKRNRQSSGGKEGAKKRWGNGGENRLPNGYPISSPNGLPYSNKIIIDKKRGDESKGDCKGVAVKRESNNASATTGADKPRKQIAASRAGPHRQAAGGRICPAPRARPGGCFQRDPGRRPVVISRRTEYSRMDSRLRLDFQAGKFREGFRGQVRKHGKVATAWKRKQSTLRNVR